MATHYHMVAVATDGRRFKLVGGKIYGTGEKPGDDAHISRFEAIAAACTALHAWMYRPQGLRVDIEARAADYPEDTQCSRP